MFENEFIVNAMNLIEENEMQVSELINWGKVIELKKYLWK